ncbi:MAG TPA: glucose-1-phosphate thymidylyltransferase, partial [Actinomycetota bacterium]|nr:glucose-1-phosphate thymidylyltransferase [Actinomycetota bacterium]
HGYQVRAEMITGWWKDTGKREDLLEANRIMLDQRSRDVLGDVDDASHLVGEVIVESGATVRESVIRGPSIVGPGARIERSTLGPYVSVYENTEIEDSEIADSIILEESRISGVRPMRDSLVGKRVRLTKDEARPAAYRYMLGDSSEIVIP